MVLGAAALAVAAIWVVGQWGATPTYVTLYRDLDLREAGQIADQLHKSSIPYRLGGGGTEVLVPVSDAASARVSLAREGLPSSGKPGLELFDKPSWAMTDFTQRVTYQRALEGELSRTVAGIRGVERAEVHLVMPVSSPLRHLERPASASVVLKLKPGTALSRETVQGIVYVVSNSVEQLSSENVAVMDDAGKVLSVPAEAGSTDAMSTRQLEVQHEVERGLEEKVEDLLATVVGNGGARARVAAELNFNQVDRTTETYNPDGQVLQTEQRSETGAGGGSEAQTIVSNAYQNSRQVEKNVSSVGDVRRLTVAVLVDSKALDGLRAKSGMQLPQIESLVRDAVGADSARGDRVSVLSVPFETVSLPPAGAAAATSAPHFDMVQVVERASRPAVSLVAIVAVLLVAVAGLRGVGGAAAARAAAASTGPAANPAAAPLPGAEVPTRSRLPADGNGELTADVVRAWLAEP
jgi:flagellar M-ring protein FliF